MWAWPWASKCVRGEFKLGLEWDMFKGIKIGRNHLQKLDLVSA
jgi:hypothetical protein